MSTSAHEGFVIDALDLDGVTVGREDGRLVATRDLAEDQISMEDVLDLADENGLEAADVVVDLPAGEARVHLEGSA